MVIGIYSKASSLRTLLIGPNITMTGNGVMLLNHLKYLMVGRYIAHLTGVITNHSLVVGGRWTLMVLHIAY